MAVRLLCIGMQAELVELRSRVLNSAGYETTPADPDSALKLLQQQPFDGVLIAANVITDRPEVEAQIREQLPQVPLIEIPSGTAGRQLLETVQRGMPTS